MKYIGTCVWMTAIVLVAGAFACRNTGQSENLQSERQNDEPDPIIDDDYPFLGEAPKDFVFPPNSEAAVVARESFKPTVEKGLFYSDAGIFGTHIYMFVDHNNFTTFKDNSILKRYYVIPEMTLSLQSYDLANSKATWNIKLFPMAESLRKQVDALGEKSYAAKHNKEVLEGRWLNIPIGEIIAHIQTYDRVSPNSVATKVLKKTETEIVIEHPIPDKAYAVSLSFRTSIRKPDGDMFGLGTFHGSTIPPEK